MSEAETEREPVEDAARAAPSAVELSERIEEAEGPLTADNTLNAEFVDAVVAAVDEKAADTVHVLCAPLHPADLADLLGLVPQDRIADLVALLGEDLSSETLAELDDDLKTPVVEALPDERLAEAITELETDNAVFVLEDMDEERRAEILAEVPTQERLALQAALDFEVESAGRLMQRGVFAAPGYWTVGRLIDTIRKTEDAPDRFFEVFVVDPAFRPTGAISLARILQSPVDRPLSDIVGRYEMRTVPVDMDQEEVAYLFEQYNLMSAPVVDETGRLVGMITVDDVMEIIHAETDEDMYALAGVEADAGLSDSVVKTVRSRFSWLAVNLLTAIMASVVIALFGGAIEQLVALAVLMPIVASMGGNAGTQTLTVAVRSLATKNLTASNAARIFWRETLVGGLNGAMFAVIMGVLAGVYYAATTPEAEPSAAFALAGVVGVAMIINLICAGMAGILVPLGLQRAGQDPAVSSAVFVTTVTDIVGFFVFLGLAAALLL
ncbi:MAG: magnesium transporter [Pseudomonadota bacterium]